MKPLMCVLTLTLALFSTVAHARGSATVNENLLRIARCETGTRWTHHARSEHPGHWYEGGLGFLDSTWDAFKPAGFPNGAHQATRAQQLRVGRRLVARFGGYSSWPACSRRLGLR